MIEMAVATAPDDREVRTIEGRILVELVDATRGKVFDEIGWLESKLGEARRSVDGAAQ